MTAADHDDVEAPGESHTLKVEFTQRLTQGRVSYAQRQTVARIGTNGTASDAVCRPRSGAFARSCGIFLAVPAIRYRRFRQTTTRRPAPCASTPMQPAARRVSVSRAALKRSPADSSPRLVLADCRLDDGNTCARSARSAVSSTSRRTARRPPRHASDSGCRDPALDRSGPHDRCSSSRVDRDRRRPTMCQRRASVRQSAANATSCSWISAAPALECARVRISRGRRVGRDDPAEIRRLTRTPARSIRSPPLHHGVAV
jgi:hypothetical protein